MKRIYIISIIILSCMPALSQTFTIPAPDGTTIVSKAGVWSCVVPPSSPSAGLPTGLTFINGVFTAPKISTAELFLTGGTVYAAGNYLANFDASGNITWTPYVPPVIPPPVAPVVSQPYSVTLPATAGVPSEMTASVTLKIAGITSSQNTVTTGPVVVPPGGNWDWEAYISAPGVVTVQVRNKTWASVNFPSTVFIVKVQ